MLQIELKTFASDALEDAMKLAQTKSLNSYTWSDCLNYLNYAWSDVYNRVACIDDGYYSVTVRLNTTMTRLPPFVKNSIKVFGAQELVGFNRDIFRSSGMADLRARNTYHISGLDLFCPDATRRTVWLSFVPIAPMLFFPMNNRDPKLLDHFEEFKPVVNFDYHLHTVVFNDATLTYKLVHKNAMLVDDWYDLSKLIDREEYSVHYLSCDYPYIFVTYKHRYIQDYYVSGFYRDILKHAEFVEYNPFDYIGRRSNVEYLKCTYNDKTGMGVIIRDYGDYDNKYYEDHKNDNLADERLPQWPFPNTSGYFNPKRFRIKELGYTPDTVVVYPCPEMYRYLVARLADKFSAFNESNVMAVQKELVESKYAFEAFCERDKSSWKRIDNVNTGWVTDLL